MTDKDLEYDYEQGYSLGYQKQEKPLDGALTAFKLGWQHGLIKRKENEMTALLHQQQQDYSYVVWPCVATIRRLLKEAELI